MKPEHILLRDRFGGIIEHQINTGRGPGRPRNLESEISFADPFNIFPAKTFTPYNPSALVTRRGLKIFEEMRRDDQVKAALAFKKHTVLSSGWQIKSPDGQPDDWEPTEFVRQQLIHMRGTMEGTLLQIMSSLDFGFSCSEKIFEQIPRERPFAGKIGLKAIKTRHPRSIEVDVTEYGDLRGIIQQGVTDPSKPFPTEKFVFFVHQFEFGNWYGTSDLEASYTSWFVKNHSYKWLGMLLERYGIPPIFVLYDPENFSDPTQLNNLKTAMQNLQGATSGMIPRNGPDSLEMWTPELAGQVSQVFVPSIEMFNRDIARGVLMPGMLGITPDRLGSLARAKVVFDVFMFAINFLRRQLEESVVNEQIIQPLVALNYNVDEFPAFEFNPVEMQVEFDTFKTWSEMVGINAVQQQPEDEDHIRQQLGFPPRGDVEEEEPPVEDPEEEESPEGEPEEAGA